jgi:predicted nucleotidyltransferase
MAQTVQHRRLSREDLVHHLRSHAPEIQALGVTSLDLFGSRARGDARTDSDLDVLIDYDGSRPFTLWDLARVKRYLEKITALEVHVSTRDGFRLAALHKVLQHAVHVF